MSDQAQTSNLPRERKNTAEKLVRAAADEFNAHGYDGTDSNKIARRAGFSPQTFYRWFEDKADIFIKVYEFWQREELAVFNTLLAENAGDPRLADAAVEHHKAYLVFRRSLRHLSTDNDAVRAARARSRLNQLAYIRRWNPDDRRTEAELAAILLQTERLADALAEGEFRDMGLSEDAGRASLAKLLGSLRRPG